MSEITGIEELRRAVNILDCCNESFNEEFTAEQLLQIIRIHVRSGWDFWPSQWAAEQVIGALCDVVPTWDRETEKPVLRAMTVIINDENGEHECTLQDFCRSNEVDVCCKVYRMQPGEVLELGGGAAPAVKVRVS